MKVRQLPSCLHKSGKRKRFFKKGPAVGSNSSCESAVGKRKGPRIFYRGHKPTVQEGMENDAKNALKTSWGNGSFSDPNSEEWLTKMHEGLEEFREGISHGGQSRFKAAAIGAHTGKEARKEPKKKTKKKEKDKEKKKKKGAKMGRRRASQSGCIRQRVLFHPQWQPLAASQFSNLRLGNYTIAFKSESRPGCWGAEHLARCMKRQPLATRAHFKQQ